MRFFRIESRSRSARFGHEAFRRRPKPFRPCRIACIRKMPASPAFFRLLLSFTGLAFFYPGCTKNAVAPLVIRDIGLYAGPGTWAESVTALERAFGWMGYSVTRLQPGDMEREELGSFELFCFPGGDMVQYSQDISIIGKDHIRNAIENGTGYIGVCGGAYFAAERVYWQGTEMPSGMLGLFEGKAEGPHDDIVPYPQYGICTIDVKDTTHSVTHGFPSSMSILYYWGPSFTPDPGSEALILGRYRTGNRTAILALEFGSGRVFMIGTHPEIEEDDPRDGCDFGEELDDGGSDWDFLASAVSWCMHKK